MQSPHYDGVVCERTIHSSLLDSPQAALLQRIEDILDAPPPPQHIGGEHDNDEPNASRRTLVHVITPLSFRIDALTLLRICTLLALGVQLAVSIYLWVHGIYHWRMYTLWSFTMLTVFYLVLTLALFFEHLLFTLTVLFALPLVLGNVVFVVLAVTVILANNAQVMIEGTVCNTPVAGTLTMEQMNTGHWTLHGWPPFSFLVILLLLLVFARRIVLRSIRRMDPAQQWLFFLFWVSVPFVPLTIYQLIFDVDKQYPTSFSVLERTAIMAAIVLVWQTLMFFVFTVRTSIDQLDTALLPTLHELLDSVAHIRHDDNNNSSSNSIEQAIVGRERVVTLDVLQRYSRAVELLRAMGVDTDGALSRPLQHINADAVATHTSVSHYSTNAATVLL